MDSVYTFLTRKELQGINVSMKTVFERITNRTLECFYFIQEHSKNKKFRKVWLYRSMIFDELTYTSRDEDYQEHGFRNSRPHGKDNSIFDRLLQDFQNEAAGDM